MPKKVSLLVITIITIVLEALPFGSVLTFANPEGEPWRNTFSYFDPINYGWLNFAPNLTAILTCVLLVLSVIYIIRDNKKVNIAYSIISAIALITSLMTILRGIRYFTVVGALISLCLLLNTIISLLKENKKQV